MRRIIAAFVGVVLAIIGAFLVMNYAASADERAAADLATEPVVVALEEIPVGTPVAEFGDRVQVQQIPGSAVVDGAVRDLADIDSLVLTTATVPGEQLTRSRLVTEAELRARGEAELPEELANHHQVTVLLDKARALGGDIAPGDRVGVFMSYTIDTEKDEQSPSEEDVSQNGDPIAAGGSQVDLTDLTLHKVPVVKVEGAFVPPAVRPGEEEESSGSAEDRIFVTFAVEPDDAAKLIFAAEWGSIWLSLEPEGASDDDVPSVIISLPSRGQDVLE